ncbi:MAG: methionyl-tRNA formyltransferase [Brevinematia bacterium]
MKKVCYFGSGEFSKKVLEGILNIKTDFVINMVITKPDKEKGRGRILTPTPVKETALQHNIEVYDKNDIKSKEFIDMLKEKNFDLFIVCDYGKIIPEEVFKIPKMKTIGIHPSLLPLYRGPSPIQYALLNSEDKTGTTIFLINEQMDAGDISLQREVKIEENDDYYSLSEKLAKLSIELIKEFFTNYEKITPIKQDETKATYSKIILKEDGKIDWSKSAKLINGKVKAFIEWPKAYCFYKGRMIKILKSSYSSKDTKGYFGEVVEINNNNLGIKTGNGILYIERLLPENSREMDAKSFVNGYRVKIGDVFE